MINSIREIKQALSAYKKAHSFIKKHRLYYWMLLPVLLNILIFSLFVSLGWTYAELFSQYIFRLVNIESWELGSFQFIVDVFQFVIGFILKLISILIYLSIIKYLILILLAPLLAYLSEKTEELYTGNVFPFEFRTFVKNILRGIFVALRNVFLEIALTIAFALLSFVPLIGILSPFLSFIGESYFFGYSMLDYYCERKKMTISEGTKFINQHISFTIINGLIFNLVLILPSLMALLPFLFVGILLKYFVLLPIIVLSILPVYSIVAATIGILEIEKNQSDARKINPNTL